VVAQWDRASTPLGASFSVYVSSHLALAWSSILGEVPRFIKPL
jgi:hypothetical protein